MCTSQYEAHADAWLQCMLVETGPAPPSREPPLCPALAGGQCPRASSRHTNSHLWWAMPYRTPPSRSLRPCTNTIPNCRALACGCAQPATPSLRLSARVCRPSTPPLRLSVHPPLAAAPVPVPRTPLGVALREAEALPSGSVSSVSTSSRGDLEEPGRPAALAREKRKRGDGGAARWRRAG